MGLTVLVLLVACSRTGPFEAETDPSAPSEESREGEKQAQASEFRLGDWTQTTEAEFATGERSGIEVTDASGGELRLSSGVATGTYTSPQVRSDFAFNSIVATWGAELPPGSSLQVELRTFVGPEGWTAWQLLTNVQRLPSRAQYAPEAPLMLVGGEQFQVRVTMEAGPGGSPVLHDITVTYMDTSAGPTTADAKFRTMVSPPTAHGVPQPPVISRAGWGADESLRTWEPERRTVQKIVFHHTVTTNDYGEDVAAQWVRAVYVYHAVTLGWGDIGYNYLVDRYGNVYEGRYGGPDAVGGHVYGYNYGSVGIALLGTHGNASNSAVPDPAALEALARLSTWESSRSLIHPLERSRFWDAYTYTLAGHRDYLPERTSCPGDLAHGELLGLRQQVWEHLQAFAHYRDVEWLFWSAPGYGGLGSVLQANTRYTVTIGVRNKGTMAWRTAGTDLVRLGYHWLDSSGQPVAQPPEHDHRTPLQMDVTFGHTTEFPVAQVTTPGEPGTYSLQWDLVHEKVTWFHDSNPESPLLSRTFEVTEAPPLPSCTELLVNGGFETDEAWEIADTPAKAQFTDAAARTGLRSLQAGIIDPVRNVYSYSSAQQRLSIPATANATLTMWYLVPAEGGTGDYGYVMLLPEGGRWQFLDTLSDRTSGWERLAWDMSVYAGQTITLRIGMRNDGRTQPMVLYADNVSLQSCRP
jgi:hypothetical protein